MASPGGMDEEGSGGDMPILPLAIVRKDFAIHFSEDSTWHGSNYFASITSFEGRLNASQYLYLWLVFANMFDHNYQFGPWNVYNIRSTPLVSEFVIEQWCVHPVHAALYPSIGKTVHYLLTFEGGDGKRLMRKYPCGWTKIGCGLACRFISPMDVYRNPFPITIT